MSVLELSLAALALAVGGVVQGSIGFGALLVAAPVLVLVDPAFVPGPGIVAGSILVVLIAWRDRAGIDVRGVGWTLAGRLPGTVVGAAAVARLSATGLEFLFGTLLLAGVLLTAVRPHLERTPALLTGVGAVSGLMGTATSVGGPPLALVYQREAGPTVRATINAIFVVGTPMSLGMLALVGELSSTDIANGMAISPGIVVGFLISGWTAPRADARALRPLILAFAAAAAAAVLARAAFSL